MIATIIDDDRDDLRKRSRPSSMMIAIVL